MCVFVCARERVCMFVYACFAFGVRVSDCVCVCVCDAKTQDAQPFGLSNALALLFVPHLGQLVVYRVCFLQVRSGFVSFLL